MHIVKATTNKNISDREKKNAALARETAAEGFVLLKNDGVLPIVPQKIALYGSGARMTVIGGSGSGAMNQRYHVTVEEGLKKAGYSISTESWLDRFDAFYKESYAEWKNGIEEVGKSPEMMKNPFALIDYVAAHSFLYPTGIAIEEEDIHNSDTDTVIYVLSRQAGEGMDRKNEKGDFKLDDIEVANLKKIASAYRKVLLVINIGGVVDLSPLDDLKIGAILFYAQGGMEGGNAFADVISGKVTPSGKLTCSWAKRYEDYPSSGTFSYYGDSKQQEYKEGIFIGYRYFDSFQIEPRYPFGFGLSYTSFEINYGNEREEKGDIILTVTVKNTGKVAGKEVVQLYVTVPRRANIAEYQRLVCFHKTKLLQPNESESFEMRFALKECACYYPAAKAGGKGSWWLNKGMYVVRIGNSSRNTRIALGVHLLKEVCTESCEGVCFPKKKINELYLNLPENSLPLGVKVLTIGSAHFETKSNSYPALSVYGEEISEKVKNTIESMTTEELVELVVGPGTQCKTYVTTLGVSGNTTSALLEKYSIPNITLADGPAGLNVTPEIVDTEAEVKTINIYPQFDFGMFGQIMRMRLGKPEDGVMRYQYATAWPVGILMAQTWNEELIEKVGQAIGDEMQELGVTVWLAPGINLYRNPLCGRVFEYYSEDPFVAGKMASAATRGVQSRKGCFVSVKHFACNNQELDRSLSSSNLNERALRELYLKAFEIVVKEAHPRTVMASYNLINGVYTTNSYDLLVKVLRNEWGFDGLVMSDWNAVDNGHGDPVQAMKAQCDLIMPGKPELKERIVKAVQSGELKADDLKRCAARVLQLVSENIVVAF